jgi:hypothetical protein
MDIDTEALIKLIQRPLLERITNEDILDCVFNREEVEAIYRKPGQIFKGTLGFTLASERLRDSWITASLR